MKMVHPTSGLESAKLVDVIRGIDTHEVRLTVAVTAGGVCVAVTVG